jgi:predicted esterase
MSVHPLKLNSRFGVLLLLASGAMSACGSDTLSDDTATDKTSIDLDWRPLSETSDGECPNKRGRSRFSSNGQRRRVEIVVPDNPQGAMPVVFTFHGLLHPSYDAIGAMVNGFQLQQEANARNTIFVVPEATEVEIPLIGSFLLWDVLDGGEDDLVLFDDLRTCLVEQHEIDLSRVHAWGMSGGGLWTSMLTIHRADALASVVEFSGGSDLELPIEGGPFIVSQGIEFAPPALLVAGGTGDVWPDPILPVIDFAAATDTLQASLLAANASVVRCDNDLGHAVITNEMWALAMDWMNAHALPNSGQEASSVALLDGCRALP